jgi:hypothetical protein
MTSGLARELSGILGKWLIYSLFIAAAIYGIFYILGMRGLDLILVLWSSVIASSIFAIPYEDYWDHRLYHVLFGVTASLIITSFALLTVSVLAQNIIEYHISSSLMMPAIFISGIILTIFTRNYWSLEKLQAIKSMAMYGILGETFLLSLGEAISGMADVEIWVRGLFFIVVLIIIIILGVAILRTMGDEWKPW